MLKLASRLVAYSLVFYFALTSSVGAQTGKTTFSENQIVGTIEGSVTIEEKAQPRFVRFVAYSREGRKLITQRILVEISSSDSFGMSTGVLWSFLTVTEAKQAITALQRMSDLANRKPSKDYANKSVTYRTDSGFVLQYREYTDSTKLFTIFTGDGGGRKCEFTSMEYIKLAQDSIKRGIEWMYERPDKSSKSRTRLKR